MENVTVTVKLKKDVRDRVDTLSKTAKQSRSSFLSNAIENYLDVYEWQTTEIRKAIQYADSPAAEFISHEEIKKEFQNTVA
jgi:RHH-type transcriptional regulator, rel operon repressor / antitoxin RelB